MNFKFKVVVASLGLLGLVSSPMALAGHGKHKHSKMMNQQQTASNPDYKDVGFKDAPVCTISPSTVTMVEMTQNVGRSLPNPCNPGWFNRIQLSGGVNVDLGKFGSRNGNFMGENYQHVSLNDAYLNLAATVNDWASVFASLSYNTATINAAPTSGTAAGMRSEYSAAYSNNITGALASSTVQLEQGFATLGNFDVSPLFVQVGKQFQDFGRYEIHPITRSMTQVMSETLATSIKLGFLVPMGFHGSIFAFDTPLNQVTTAGSGTTSASTNADYGVALGYDNNNEQLGFDLGAAWLYNMMGVNDIAYNVGGFNLTSNAVRGYTSNTGGYALYADVNSGPFTLGARYTATQKFNRLDLPTNGTADVVGGGLVAGAVGAKPWAAGVQAGYGFDAWGKGQNVYLGYQASRQASGLGLPRSRWLAGYGLDMWKNTSFGIEWDNDSDYAVANGGSGNSYNLVTIRSTVKFG